MNNSTTTMHFALQNISKGIMHRILLATIKKIITINI